MKTRPYPKYKPSGISWLGNVPEHWDVKRTRFMVSINPSKQEIVHLLPETEVSFLPMEAVGDDGRLNLQTSRPISEVNSGYTYFAEGDVTFAKITPCFENGKGAIMQNLCNNYGFGTTELTVLRSDAKTNTKYLYYVTISSEFRKIGEAWMYGASGQKRVPDDFVRNFHFSWPPFPEQQMIAAFLDRKTEWIDSLVAKKKRLVELLKEKRTALISHAVTRGFDSSVKLKPSGVPWLGDVPKHWEVKRLRFLVTLQTGITLGKDYKDRALVSYPYLRVANVQDGYLDLNTITEILIPSEEAPHYKLQPGDVLMTEGGDFDKLGRGYVWEDEIPNCLHQNHIFAVRPDKAQLDSHFLAAVISSAYGRFYFTSTSQQTTNLATTNSGKIKDFAILLPPQNDQKEIMKTIWKKTDKIDTLIAKVEEAIEKLTEYRTALISAAVTGKIDVREEVA